MSVPLTLVNINTSSSCARRARAAEARHCATVRNRPPPRKTAAALIDRGRTAGLPARARRPMELRSGSLGGRALGQPELRALRQQLGRHNRSSLTFVENQTASVLRLVAAELVAGQWWWPPPYQIAPFTTAVFAATTAGMMSGTAGHVIYADRAGNAPADGGALLAGFWMEWSAPFLGAAECCGIPLPAGGGGGGEAAATISSRLGGDGSAAAHTELSFVVRGAPARSWLYSTIALRNLFGGTSCCCLVQVKRVVATLQTVELALLHTGPSVGAPVAGAISAASTLEILEVVETKVTTLTAAGKLTCWVPGLAGCSLRMPAGCVHRRGHGPTMAELCSATVRAGLTGTHSPCSKYRLPSSPMALITSVSLLGRA